MIIERNDIHLSNRDAELTYEKGVVGGPVDCNPGDLSAIFVLKMCMKELCHEYSQRIKNFWTQNLWNHALQLDPMALRALFHLVMVESPTSTAAWFGMSGYFDNTL